jgi:asparagine synthase (glutamine-hydrolysing)
LVVALMQAQSSQKIRTFSIGNPTAQYDESAAAAQVAAHLGTDHTTFTVTAEDAWGVVPELGGLYDEPFADSSQIPTLLVSRLARAQVTVALTGDGGDEVFAGYNRHVWGPRVWAALKVVPRPARAVLARGLLSVSPERYDALLGRALPARIRPRLLGGKVHKLGSVLNASTSDAFYRTLCSQWLEPERLLTAPASSEPSMPVANTGSFATDMMLLDLVSYLPDDVLTKVDRATMAVALEARAPFLDHRVVELGWRLPLSMKVRGSVGKSALRDLLHRYVPRALVDRPKMGFAVPIGSWLRGPLRDWAEELLRSDTLRAQPYFRVDSVRSAWRDHVSGARDNGAQLWTLLMLQSWLNGPNGPSRPRTSS